MHTNKIDKIDQTKMATIKTDHLNDPNENANKNNTDIIDKNLYQTLTVNPSLAARPICY